MSEHYKPVTQDSLADLNRKNRARYSQDAGSIKTVDSSGEAKLDELRERAKKAGKESEFFAALRQANQRYAHEVGVPYGKILRDVEGNLRLSQDAGSPITEPAGSTTTPAKMSEDAGKRTWPGEPVEREYLVHLRKLVAAGDVKFKPELEKLEAYIKRMDAGGKLTPLSQGYDAAPDPRAGARLSGRGKVSPEAEQRFAEEIERGRKKEQ